MACAWPLASPTPVSAAKASRASSAIGGRSHWPAGGSAADMASVACQRAANLSATASQAFLDPPVRKVSF